MIKLQNVTKAFRTDEIETTALNSINLDVEKGEFVAVMGPSGCGKSTLLNILGMIDNVTEGSYFFNGENVAGYSERQLSTVRKLNLGFIFQSFNLIDELSVFENVELPLLYQGISAAERKQRVDAVLEKIAIIQRRNHLPQQLSGGQQQRVAVARAVVSNPKLILADEPTGNLDPVTAQEIIDLLFRINDAGTCVVFSTHDHQIVKTFGQRVLVINNGKIESDIQRRGPVDRNASLADNMYKSQKTSVANVPLMPNVPRRENTHA